MVIPRLQMSDLTLYPFWFSSGLILSGCQQRQRWVRSRDAARALPMPRVGLLGRQHSTPQPTPPPHLPAVLAPHPHQEGQAVKWVTRTKCHLHRGLGWWS